MALEALGGRKVLTAVLQYILNVLDFGMGMQGALSAPRIHVEAGLVPLDARISEDVWEELRRTCRGVVLREETYISSYFGRPNGILVDGDKGTLKAAWSRSSRAPR